MPYYKRRTYRKRRTYKKRYTPPAQPSTMSTVAKVASTALGIAKFVKSVINVEFKRSDLNIIPTGFTYTGITGNFHNISQGNTALTRNGDSIKVSSLYVSGCIFSGAAEQVARIIIVRGIREQGVAPALGDILEDTGVVAVNSARAVNDSLSYKVLYDRKFVLNEGTSGSTKMFKCYLKLGDHIKYNTGTNTPANGGIYYWILSNVNVSSPQVQFCSRLRFIDN